MPLIGPLFGTTNRDRRRTELVVLITPIAVHDSEAAHRITDEFRERMRSLEPFEAEPLKSKQPPAPAQPGTTEP